MTLAPETLVRRLRRPITVRVIADAADLADADGLAGPVRPGRGAVASGSP